MVSQVAYLLDMFIKPKTDSKSTCDKFKDDEVFGPCSIHSRGLKFIWYCSGKTQKTRSSEDVHLNKE